MRETKTDRFARVAEARVNKLLSMLRLLGNCANPCVYDYSDEQVEQIFTTLQTALDTAREKYAHQFKGKHRFSLTESPMPNTISAPHITITLPDQTKLRAVAYSGDNYPTIQIYRLGVNDTAELICFAEFNPEKSSGRELCVGTYQSDDEETKYYASYEAEGTIANEYISNT